MTKSLINIPVKKSPCKERKDCKEFECADCACSFLKNLDTAARKRLQSMLNHGIKLGDGIANAYHVSPERFNAEIIKIVGGF